jgi:hypothetical protein
LTDDLEVPIVENVSVHELSSPLKPAPVDAPTQLAAGADLSEWATDLSLEDLVVAIAREHELVRSSLSNGLNHALRAGDLLLDARARIPHGQWGSWLADQDLNITMEHATTYMRIARHRDLVIRMGATTLGQARGLLASSSARDSRIDPTLVAEAQRLRASGLLLREIGEELGVSPNTVQRWVNPAAEERYRAKRRKMTRAGRSALRKEQRSKAARQIGGDLGEAYSLIRRALDLLENASTQHAKGTRRHIRSSMASLYNAEDEIARAIKEASVK